MEQPIVTIVFGCNGGEKLPDVLYCGHYTLKDAIYKLAADKEQKFDPFVYKDGAFYTAAEELAVTQEEANSQYERLVTLAGKYTEYELIPVKNLTDVGNEKFLEAVKRIADNFSLFKQISEYYHLLSTI